MEHLKNWLVWLFEGINKYADKEFKENIFHHLGENCYKKSIMNEVSEKISRELVVNVSADNTDQVVEFLSKTMTDFTFNKKIDGFTVNLNNNKCFCPVVNEGLVSDELMCNCTKGFDKKMYETILKREVEITIIDSLLKNGKSCLFQIKIF